MSDRQSHPDSRFIESKVSDSSIIRAKIYATTYWVEYWSATRTGPESWRIKQALDLMSVVRWARSHRTRSRFVVYVEHSGSDGVTLHRVYDGFDSPDT